jgi:uncharacterized Fe-S cluster protein YjdI
LTFSDQNRTLADKGLLNEEEKTIRSKSVEKPVQEYRCEKITVRFDPKICTHSGNCVKSLPGVFDISKKPWVSVEGADVEQVTQTVNACPSGALSCETP